MLLLAVAQTASAEVIENLDAASRESKHYDRDTEQGRSQGASPD